MLCKIVLLALAGLASCAVIDDGSYDAERYEIPYVGETSDNARSARTYAPAGGNLVQHAAPAPSRASYNADPRTAQILSEARYLQADGKFGASYTQEDGVQFKEEADPDGTRRGSYSWVDPSGQRRTVSYVAGKFGFQASGEHLPEQPPLVLGRESEPQAQSRYVQAQPQYQPEPQVQSRYVAPQPQPQQYVAPQPQPQRYVAPQSQPQQYAAPQPQPQRYVAPQPQPQQYVAPQQYSAPQPQAYRPKPAYRAPAPVAEEFGPSHPSITQSTADSYSISAAF